MNLAHDEKDAKGELLPCPFCGRSMALSTVARDWWRVTGEHAEDCILSGIEWDVPQTADQRAVIVGDWNRRADTARIVAKKLEAVAAACELIEKTSRHIFKKSTGAGRGDSYFDGVSDGAGQCVELIRAQAPKPDAGEKPAKRPLTRCAAGSDGDCSHSQCPQMRDGEPLATGRHCPIDRTER